MTDVFVLFSAQWRYMTVRVQGIRKYREASLILYAFIYVTMSLRISPLTILEYTHCKYA
jgi:hypothetical protein